MQRERNMSNFFILETRELTFEDTDTLGGGLAGGQVGVEAVGDGHNEELTVTVARRVTTAAQCLYVITAAWVTRHEHIHKQLLENWQLFCSK